MHKFNVTSQEYNTNDSYNVDEHCNAVTVINKGNSRVMANGILLMPSPLNVNPGDRFGGESVVMGGNQGEIFVGPVTLQFVAGTGTENSVLVIQKFYVK